jgi:hypothetical protein
MARAKKTVHLRALIDRVNARNELSLGSGEVERARRDGWNSFLENVLSDADAYAGFGYLRSGEVPPGVEPGIIFDESEERAHQYPDPSRKRYFYHRGI